MSEIKYSKSEHLIFFEECKLVEGYYNSIFYDLVRSNNSNEVPKSFVDFYNKAKESDLKSLIESYPKDDQEIVMGYIDFVIDREFGTIGDFHLKENLRNYPEKYEIPSLIENMIIVVDSINVNYMTKVIFFIEKLGVLALEIRILEPNVNDFKQVEQLFENTVVETIIQRSYYSKEIHDEIINVNFIRTKEISLYNAPVEKKHEVIRLKNSDIDLSGQWHRIYRKPFTIDRRFYIEAHQSLNYFHSKLYIGVEGDIRNAPECQEIYGNIDHINDYSELRDIIATNSFQKYWHISKDQVDICKDCEFRYMCLDNRLPVKRSSDNTYFYDQPCSYNPYISKWSDEDGYQSLDECGVLSNGTGFQINHEKIALINKDLWGD